MDSILIHIKIFIAISHVIIIKACSIEFWALYVLFINVITKKRSRTDGKQTEITEQGVLMTRIVPHA